MLMGFSDNRLEMIGKDRADDANTRNMSQHELARLNNQALLNSAMGPTVEEQEKAFEHSGWKHI